jgi:hypothetical protein
MMIPWITLAVALAALVVAVIALYRATHTERKVMVIPPPCSHKWSVRDFSNQTDRNYRCTGYVYIMQCANCGDLKDMHVNVNGRNRTEH